MEFRVSSPDLTLPTLLDAVNEAPDLICLCDDEGTVVFASDAATTLLGRSPSELRGSDMGLLDHVDDQATMAYARAESWRREEPVRRLHRVRQARGGFRWLDTILRVIHTDRGRFSLSVSRDATGVLELVRTGRLSRERLSTLVGALSDAVVLTDPKGDIVAASDAWVELLDQPGDPTGSSAATVCRWRFGPEAGLRVEQLLRHASAREVPQQVLLPAATRQGQVLVTATPLVTPVVGGVEHTMVVFRCENGSHQVDETAARRVRALTGREVEVMRGLGEGFSPRELAQRLGICESTVRGYVKTMLQKLQVHSQLQAVLVGMKAGVVPVPTGGDRGEDGQ